ncbi:hypothetical protein CC78DRAFT_618770 [Lojkania enalia]|uniref:Uncharacterized protein n=1 Tax=Lojkania enalia TaxID=147567 RepID=A0A9P4K6Z7_9PLEO|nr:hypothetical protein CC78DRAFT_618770 [Didymosphaeria enalia]
MAALYTIGMRPLPGRRASAPTSSRMLHLGALYAVRLASALLDARVQVQMLPGNTPPIQPRGPSPPPTSSAVLQETRHANIVRRPLRPVHVPRSQRPVYARYNLQLRTEMPDTLSQDTVEETPVTLLEHISAMQSCSCMVAPGAFQRILPCSLFRWPVAHAPWLVPVNAKRTSGSGHEHGMPLHERARRFRRLSRLLPPVINRRKFGECLLPRCWI